jgi:gluconate 2-dehydrogenase gamma chain
VRRRELLRRAGGAALGAGASLSPAAVAAAHEHLARQASAKGVEPLAGPPGFFQAHEWSTVRCLCGLVIPADERSLSAVDALVPEFIDYVLRDPLSDPDEREKLQTRLRGGLAWLDRECEARFGRRFVECADVQQADVLDAIAWPDRTPAGLAAGAAFFTLFRDLVASGYWTSRMGMEDLGYTGNTYVAEWKGCPPEVLARLDLKPEE